MGISCFGGSVHLKNLFFQFKDIPGGFAPATGAPPPLAKLLYYLIS